MQNSRFVTLSRLIAIGLCALGALDGARLMAQASVPPAPRTASPIAREEVPERKRIARAAAANWKPPHTSWGEPDIAGVYSSSDESGVPFERPDEFAGRTLKDFTPAELAEIVKRRQDQTIERAPTLSEFPGATSPMHWFEFYNADNSRPWLISDPPDGKVPATTREAAARAAATAAARKSRGPADSWEDRSLWDRCVTRGIPTSMLPTLYGNSYFIQQSPGYVTITYEMVHDTRVIPIDAGPHVSDRIRQYLGNARGHWEGDTLVVETTNFTSKTPYRGSSEHLKMTERFRAVSPGAVEWSVTFDDPHTWVRPWTFAMNLTKLDDSQQPFEYACHEGNYGLRNILTAARAAEAAGPGAR
jgi:hypothetical protein